MNDSLRSDKHLLKEQQKLVVTDVDNCVHGLESIFVAAKLAILFHSKMTFVADFHKICLFFPCAIRNFPIFAPVNPRENGLMKKAHFSLYS